MFHIMNSIYIYILNNYYINALCTYNQSYHHIVEGYWLVVILVLFHKILNESN
jgi:hypothetical protein